MALIQTPEAPITDPAILTANAIKNGTTQLFSVLTRGVNQLFNLIYKNPKLTPQEAFASLEADAAQAHQLYLAISQIMNSVKPGTCPTVPFHITVNQDGTVVVGSAI